MSKIKRLFALGCNHGNLANPNAVEAALKFADKWKAEIRVHLGDNYDTQFLMSSKVRDGNGVRFEPDLLEGQRFLRRYKPTVYCIGNHEQRAFDLRSDRNEVIAYAAEKVADDMLAPVKHTGCKIIPYTIHASGWFKAGGFKFGHGHLWNENYLRDTAEAVGNAVVAHAHRAGVAKGRRSDNPTAYGVGCLMDPENAAYANRRRSTLSWSYGCVWGEVTEREAYLFLCEWPANTTDFRLPI